MKTVYEEYLIYILQNELSKLDHNSSIFIRYIEPGSTVIWNENRANRASDNQADSNNFLVKQ